MNSKTTISISNAEAPFGNTAIHFFTLTRKNGITAKISNFGSTLMELHVPDSDGKMRDVVLGFKDLETYLKENIYAGAIVGRIAGRLNQGRFFLDGKVYQLTQNEGSNHLHGGHTGFDKQIWDYKIIETASGKALELRHKSPHGSEGYPGNLKVTVRYILTDENGLQIKINATTDRPTPFCPTEHSYFNLSAEADIKKHRLKIESDEVVEVNTLMLPTGKINKVSKGINNFGQAALLGVRLPLLHRNHGDNYLTHTSGAFKKVAQVSAENRSMEVWTTAPHLQLYTGSGLHTTASGKSGSPYRAHAGLCLECQGLADAPNHNAFASIILRPDENFEQVTEYRFGVV
ncbi:aldose epimerase family protein [Maribacter sp. 2210JD10-5]|uniref:aldose epimerase family protein n=1 Tax=Maribacter sp. 2210JD10-5 TaxID=3386272 RepID=UPI0039BC25C1